MVPDTSDRIPRAPPYSGCRILYITLLVRAYHSLWATFPDPSNSVTYILCGPMTPTTPQRVRFRLFPFRSPLLGKSMFLSSPPGTNMFQFPGFALSLREYASFTCMGCPIRICPDHLLFADPRTFSQLTTSFLASGSLGILRSLLFTSFFLCKQPCNVFLPFCF